MTATVTRLSDRTPKHRRTSQASQPSLPSPLFPGSDPISDPDQNWSLIAADFASLGCTAETFPMPPGMTTEEHARMCGLIARHAASGVAAASR